MGDINNFTPNQHKIMGDVVNLNQNKDECTPEIHMDEDDGQLCPVCESQTLTEALMIQGSKWRAERVQTRHIIAMLSECLKCVEPVEGNDDAVFEAVWEECGMGEALVQAKAWLENNPEVRMV